MASVLLTGAEGFTGRYVADALRQAGYRVLSLVRGVPTQADHFQADLTDADALRALMLRLQPDCVVHLAALAFVARQDVESFYRVNLVGTLILLDALITSSSPVRKVIVSSSANVYGNARHSPVAEDTCPAPVNHYAMSKLAMEHMALTRLDKLPIVITRPFNYTGVGQDDRFLIPKIVAHFKRRDPVIRLGNLDVEREFNDDRMVAQAYLGLLEKADAGEIVNICSGQGWPLGGVVDRLAQMSGHHLDIEVDPGLVRANEVRTLVGSPAKLQATAGPLPAFTLEKMLEWMLR